MKTLREKLQKTLEDALLGKVWHSEDRRVKSGRIVEVELTYENGDCFTSGSVKVEAGLDTGRWIEIEMDTPLSLQGIEKGIK